MESLDLRNLDYVLCSYDIGIHIYFFYTKVLENSNLTEEDKKNFQEIWKKASDFELWNYSDIIIGCKACSRFIRENYSLSEKAINVMVKYIAFNWK